MFIESIEFEYKNTAEISVYDVVVVVMVGFYIPSTV